jgi:uncharacterized membrane protein YhaH (DUF805 family)
LSSGAFRTDWTWYLFRFDGRINRALLWQALLIVAMLAALLENAGRVIDVLQGAKSSFTTFEFDFDFGLDDLFRAVDPRAYHLLASADRTQLILRVIGTALFLWIYLATAIKRLHDRDRSGWWIIPFFVVPGLFSEFEGLLPGSYWMLPFSLGVSVLWLWGIVEMFFVPGTTGNNRFGPDPLARIGAAPASASSSAKNWDQQRELEFVPPRASPPGGMHVKRDA